MAASHRFDCLLFVRFAVCTGKFFWATLVDVTGISSVFLLSFGIIGVQVANKCVRRGKEVSLKPRDGGQFSHITLVSTL